MQGISKETEHPGTERSTVHQEGRAESLYPSGSRHARSHLYYLVPQRAGQMTAVDMRFLAPTISEVFGLRQPDSCESPPLRELPETMDRPRSVVAVVFDGFGSAALRIHGTRCPTLQSMLAHHATQIRAVAPPKTPVNFATMATGASQVVHGVSEKTDPLRAETIFQVFAESGLATGVAGRMSGSPAHLFSDQARYAAIARSNKDSEVLELALELVRGRRPAFALIQFLDIDEAGHAAGPYGGRAGNAVQDTDRRLASLARAVALTEGALVVLADHGQHEAWSEEESVRSVRGRHDGLSEEDFLVPVAWCSSVELAGLSDPARSARSA